MFLLVVGYVVRVMVLGAKFALPGVVVRTVDRAVVSELTVVLSIMALVKRLVLFMVSP